MSRDGEDRGLAPIAEGLAKLVNLDGRLASAHRERRARNGTDDTLHVGAFPDFFGGEDCEPSSLLSASTRDATFTTSPMTVYSLRVRDPTFPMTTLPDMHADADPRGYDGPLGDAASKLLEDLAGCQDGVLGVVALGEGRAEDRHESVTQKLVHDAVVLVTLSIIGSNSEFK